MEKYKTFKQAARLLKIQKKDVLLLVNQGILKGERISDKSFQIKESSLKEFMGENFARANSETLITYFIQAEVNNLIKIGTTTNLKRRLISLQDGSPVKLKLVLSLPGVQFQEKILHRQFEEDRQHGEWFAPSERLMRFIHKFQNEQT